MIPFNRIVLLTTAGLIALTVFSCSDDDESASTSVDNYYVGQTVGNFDASEWYPGGELGTTSNVTAGCYEDETPATTEQGLDKLFNLGQAFFERNYNVDTKPFNGLGPAYLRASCLDCHPGYGHGKRQTGYPSAFGNGYLLAIYHPNDDNSDNPYGTESNNGSYISEVTGMPQTLATTPFLPPLDGDQISIVWNTVTSMPSGVSATQFPDGETYGLIYPTVTIPTTAFNTDPQPSNIAVRLESTIGVIGTGLIDAIDQDSIKAQYIAEQNDGANLNSSFWDADAQDFKAYYSLAAGYRADGSYTTSYKRGKRFTYALTRASLQDGPGANAIWNITNVTRKDRHYLYTTKAWAKAMSEDDDVLEYIIDNGSSLSSLLHPYYGDGSKDSVSYLVNYILGMNTAADASEYERLVVNAAPAYGEDEMTDDNYYAFLVWHRGLSIPRARNLNDEDVQRGKELFYEWGCTYCHRPKWTTTTDNYWTPAITEGKPLPRYQNQTIYPYSDFVQHQLHMVNDIHSSWCRTTPLWGRGLSLANTGAQDRLHDCRARNEKEAILWHIYSSESDAYTAAINFYNASKSDRDAVVKFLQSI